MVFAFLVPHPTESATTIAIAASETIGGAHFQLHLSKDLADALILPVNLVVQLQKIQGL